MSEVFSLPLEYAGMCFQDQSGNCFGGNDYERESEVVKVINNHDALVEINKELVESLESILWAIAHDDEGDIPLSIVSTANDLVAKAKELL